MIFKSYMFKRVAIIGVGLMGGSLAMALRKKEMAKEIVGYSQRHATLVSALKDKIIDEGVAEPALAVRNADLIVLATPVQHILAVLPVIAAQVKRGSMITDVGSTKGEIVEIAEKVFPAPGFFIGSHPLTGSEKRGLENATPDLYQEALCLMTPTEKTNPVTKEKIKQMWARVGCRVEMLKPEEHDGAMAYVSHLPHLLVFALMGVMPSDYLKLAGPGLKDTTRIASSAPQIWSDIFASNKRPLLQGLDETIKRLAEFRRAIIKKDEKTVLDFISQAKEKNDLWRK
ncbi:MAG: prephenate dehydrogenase [Candidatus Omnitrophica bacterium]|nr:prephenate dehydrogenase [Candidatus Omnitrophota bacterium]